MKSSYVRTTSLITNEMMMINKIRSKHSTHRHNKEKLIVRSHFLSCVMITKERIHNIDLTCVHIKENIQKDIQKWMLLK